MTPHQSKTEAAQNLEHALEAQRFRFWTLLVLVGLLILSFWLCFIFGVSYAEFFDEVGGVPNNSIGTVSAIIPPAGKGSIFNTDVTDVGDKVGLFSTNKVPQAGQKVRVHGSISRSGKLYIDELVCIEKFVAA